MSLLSDPALASIEEDEYCEYHVEPKLHLDAGVSALPDDV